MPFFPLNAQISLNIRLTGWASPICNKLIVQEYFSDHVCLFFPFFQQHWFFIKISLSKTLYHHHHRPLFVEFPTLYKFHCIGSSSILNPTRLFLMKEQNKSSWFFLLLPTKDTYGLYRIGWWPINVFYSFYFC